MEENAVNVAESFEEATSTGSPSIPSIFGAPSAMASVMKGDAPLHVGALQQPSVDWNKEGEQGGQDSTFALPTIPINLRGGTMEVQDSTAGANNFMGNNSETTPRRIPYDNGFGDFYFGHLRNCGKSKITEDMSEEEKSDLMGITGSNGVPVRELGDFRRSGPFPFDKLPSEIREKIIRILLCPILSTYNFGLKEREYTKVFLDSGPDFFRNLNYSTEDSYHGSEVRAEQQFKAMLYPGRKSLSQVKLYPNRIGYQSLKGPRIDWVFLRWLRQASYVGTSFRYELGKVLWSHAMISAGNDWDPLIDEMKEKKFYDNADIDEIDFLMTERPAIIQGIKGLNITLQIAEGQDISESWFFRYASNRISRLLDLDALSFTIWLDEKDLRMFVEGHKSGLDGLSVIETWRVSAHFDVELKKGYNENDAYTSDDELDHDWQDLMYQHMLPLSLCFQEPKTEEQEYLLARFETFGDTEMAMDINEIIQTEQIGEIGEAAESSDGGRRMKIIEVD